MACERCGTFVEPGVRHFSDTGGAWCAACAERYEIAQRSRHVMWALRNKAYGVAFPGVFGAVCSLFSWWAAWLVVPTAFAGWAVLREIRERPALVESMGAHAGLVKVAAVVGTLAAGFGVLAVVEHFVMFAGRG